MDIFGGISSKIADIVGGMIYAIYKSFIEPWTKIDSLEELIFGNFEVKDDVIYWGTFTSKELSLGFLPLYQVMTGLAGVFLVAFIVIAGMRIASSSLSPNRRNETLEFSKELVLVGIGLFNLPEFYSLLFSINMEIVGVFDKATPEDIFKLDFKLEDGSSLSSDTGFIGKILIELILLGLGVWANFYYLMRKVTLLILMSMGPVMLVFWMLPQFKSITMTWLKELITTIFIQAIHSFVFWTIAIISLANDSLIGTLIVYVLFIPISEQIRGLLGMSGGMQNTLSKTGSMFGLAGLGAMAGAVKGAFGDKSVMGALKGMKDGVKNKLGSEGSKDGGISSEADFASTKASKMLKAGDIVSKMGKATLGVAGAVAGSGLGPVGAIAMAEAGAKAGDIAGGFTGRVGAAVGLGVANRVMKGKRAIDELNNAREGGDDAMAEAVANQETASWTGQNRDSVMAKLRENFPSATEADLDKKFSDIVAAKKEAFTADAKANWQTAKSIANGAGNGNALVASSATAMASQWAKDNEESFNNDYDKSNPQQPGESDSAYMKRRSQAFGERKAQMKENFMKDGNTFVSAKADADGNVGRKALAVFMGEKAGSHNGARDVSNLTDAAISGMEHVAGVPMFDNAGKPNMQMITTGLASARTERMKNDHITSAMADGVTTIDQAMTSWRSKEQKVMDDNFNMYSDKGFKNQVQDTVVSPPSSTAQTIKQNADAFVGGLGWNGIKKAGGIVKAASSQGMGSLKESVAQGNFLTAVPDAIGTASTAGINQHIAQHNGDAVQAQRKVTQSVGYASGVLLGRTGMSKAQSIMSTVSMAAGYGASVQSQISSASEVIQMAQKVMDDNGNMVLAQGAIQQVTTRDGSYVQVKTNAGEVRTVSRIGAGSESLKSGQTVYQDLTIDESGKTLEVATVGRSGVSTYQMDSGGARIPVQHSVQDPISLLGNVNTPQHAYVPRPTAPVLSQRVDAGTFHTEDLASGIEKGNYKNVQVVIEKGQQYVTAETNGQTYRVSPITKGDARMDSNQTMTIPVEVTPGGQILSANGNRPASINMIQGQTIQDSNGQIIGVNGLINAQTQQVVTQTTKQNISNGVGGNATRQVLQRKVTVLQDDVGPTNETIVHTVHETVRTGSEHGQVTSQQVTGADKNLQSQSYYNDGLNFNNLMTSRSRQHAQRNINRRAELDRNRHKQGVVN